MVVVAEGAVTQAVAVHMAGVCVGGIRNHLPEVAWVECTRKHLVGAVSTTIGI